MRKNKIILLFPDGVGIRNYLYSDVFKNSEAELVLLHAFDVITESEIQNLTGINQTVAIPQYRESLIEKILRELICLSRLYHNAKITNNSAILKNWNRNHKTISKKIIYKTIEFIAPFFRNYKIILCLEKVYQKAIRKNEFYRQVRALVKEIQPDTLFCSHQRGLQCATIFAAATDMGIPTTTVIFSWDNLPKARMALRANKYLVWSAYMKQEMQLYYPEIPEDLIYVTGTPQFEFYKDAASIIDKEIYYKKYNLDFNKKIICYSGDDVLTSPDDPKYLEDLAEALLQHDLQNEYQILLRRSPVDLSGRFEPVICKYSQLIKEAPPIWNFKNKNDWTTVYALPEDVKLLVSTAFYSEVVINVGSTMAFDFSMFSKSCIFINYNQEIKKDLKWSVDWIYQLQHFRSMPEKEAVLWLNDKEEIITKIELAILGGNTNAMSKWRDVVLGDFATTSLRIKQTLDIF